MNIFNFIFFLVSIVHAGQTCDEVRCPRGRTPAKVCFVHPDFSTDPAWKASVYASCGFAKEILTTNSRADLIKHLEALNKECKSLKVTIFYGHGAPGEIQAGDFRVGNESDLEKFSCLFPKDSQILLSGCNVGKGCAGDLLLLGAAESLLKKGGIIEAPTYFATSVGVLPSFSLNFKNRRITYDPQKSPPDKWSQVGLKISNKENINLSCSEEISDLANKLEKATVEAKKKGCRVNHGNSSLPALLDMSVEMKKTPGYLQQSPDKINFITANLSKIKRQISTYEDCEPNGNSQPKGVGVK